MKQLARVRAYKVPKSDYLAKFANLLGRKVGVNGLVIVKEGEAWVLKQSSQSLSAAYSNEASIACLTGFIAGFCTAQSG